jgi:hypothetical protein
MNLNLNAESYPLVTIWDKCCCGHPRHEHYGEKYNFDCIHRMGRYTGKKCICLGFTQDNLIYLERMYEVHNSRK